MPKMKIKPLVKKHKIPLYILLNLAAIAAIPIFSVYKSIAAMYPEFFTCTFLNIFGLYCPGCGITRSVTAMLGGRIFTAIRANPGAVMSAAFLLWIDIKLGIAAFGKKTLVFKKFEQIWLIVIAVVFVLWAIIRNLILVFCGYDLLGSIV